MINLRLKNKQHLISVHPLTRIHYILLSRYYLFPIINIICIICTFCGHTGMGKPCSILILFSIVIDKRTVNYLQRDKLFSLYIVFCIASGLLFFVSRRTLIVYLAAFSYNIIPSLLYLKGASMTEDYSPDEVSKPIFGTCVFLMGFGLFFYIFFSDFYYEYIGQSIETYMWRLADYRFGSYLTSLILGSICASSIPLYYATIKTRSRLSNIICLLIIILSLILCMQRSAWVCAVVAFWGILFTEKNKGDKNIKYILGIICVLIIVINLRDYFFTTEQLNHFLGRISLTSLAQMGGERIAQWQRAIDAFVKMPIGYGIGAYGNKAGQFGFDCVYDGNYFRILVELGIVGTFLFVLLLIRAMYRSYMRGNRYIFFLLLLFSLQAIGTNVFDLFFCSFIFWFYLGYASNYSNHQRIGVYSHPLQNARICKG